MVDRIRKLLEFKSLSPSQFADEIKLQRSSLSHILSGRNKPSLDVVMKIKNRYSEVNLEWLIYGKGVMSLTKDQDSESSVDVHIDKPTGDVQQILSFGKQGDSNKPSDVASVDEKPGTSNLANISVNNGDKKANKVIIFYNNGTFEEYRQG